MTNSNRKRAVRARMAETGEKYTTALRAIQAERAAGTPPPEPAAGPGVRDSLGRETDHRTPCDEGKHPECRDEDCDCNCHSLGWIP